MSEPREVKIGSRSYEIQAFSPRKVFLASRLVKKLDKVARQVSKEAATYRREYRAENAEIITRAMTALPPWNESVLAEMTTEEWDKVGGQVEYRSDPPDDEMMLIYLGGALEAAEHEVMRLIALVLIPNEELAEAARSDGGVGPALERYSERVLDEGGIGQFVDLADAALETVREELAGKAPKIRNLKGLFRKHKPQADPAEDEADAESEGLPEETSEKRSSGSTPSPPATDGPTESASMESPSESALA